MLQRLAGRLTICGTIDRRILANYRLDPEAAAAVLPAPFKPKLVNGYAVGGLCLIRLKQIRPAVLPIPVGIHSENAAHRIAVVWEQEGTQREGVYIPRRDTNSRLNTWAGGRLFPGEHHLAKFSVRETDEVFDLSFASDDGDCAMGIRAQRSGIFPADSVFANIQAASRFFENGAVGYSATSDPGQYDGLELDCKQWSVQSLDVMAVRSSFFDDPQRFPAGAAVFDCALLMRGIKHSWSSLGRMCCATVQSGAC